ncbi:hypothetical protein KAR91_74975 [Candidatus Pacearchaeota archaeon]|nr:hypothetical protein [Candidatus Pacearchaeota archaeon]
MSKRINILTKHRIRKVVIELREIREDSKLNKIDSWNLEQATETLVQILEESENNDPKPNGPPSREAKEGEVDKQNQSTAEA